MPHNVLVVDDHKLLSQAIASLVNGFEHFTVTHIFHNGKQVIDHLSTTDEVPDVILMDVNMPIMNGLETTRLLTKGKPDLKIVALSVENDENTILEMIRNGACSYMQKDSEPEELEKALLQVIDLGYDHTPEIGKLLMNSMHGPEKKSVKFELKENEITFLKHACSELTYKEIADRMNLSPKTIEGYRDDLHKRYKIKNRIGLVLFAIREGIYRP